MAVSVQVAACVVLTATTALLTFAMRRYKTVSMGYDAERVVVAIPDYTDQPQNARVTGYYEVTPEFFEVLGVPVVDGRTFNEVDDDRSPPVVVINRRAAEAWWPGSSPLGRRVKIGSDGVWMTVVGVVENTQRFDHMGRTFGTHGQRVDPDPGDRHPPRPANVFGVRTTAAIHPAPGPRGRRGRIRAGHARRGRPGRRRRENAPSRDRSTARSGFAALADPLRRRARDARFRRDRDHRGAGLCRVDRPLDRRESGARGVLLSRCVLHQSRDTGRHGGGDIRRCLGYRSVRVIARAFRQPIGDFAASVTVP